VREVVAAAAAFADGRWRWAMKTRHPNPRLAKTYRTYTVVEVAELYDIHRNTVREWIKRGLPTIDDRRPLVVRGHDLAAFLVARRSRKKRTCQPGELYCVRCRAPRTPAGDMADFEPVSATVGNLIGICPVCDCLMNRRVNVAKLGAVSGKLEVTPTQGPSRIGDSPEPSVNSDFTREPETYAKSQP